MTTATTTSVTSMDGTTITYGHASRLLVKEGQKVEAGDMIGLVGSSGYTYGSTLYYEIQRDGKPIDAVALSIIDIRSSPPGSRYTQGPHARDRAP